MKHAPHLIAAWLLFAPTAAAQERGAPWYADRAIRVLAAEPPKP